VMEMANTGEAGGPEPNAEDTTSAKEEKGVSKGGLLEVVCAGVPQFIEQKWWEKHLRNQGIQFARTRKVSGQRFAKVTFQSFETMEDAIAKLDNTTVRGSTLKVKPAHPRLRIGPEQETEDVPAEKRRRTGDHPAELQQGEQPTKNIHDVVTPMWRLDYTDQVRKKRNAILKRLRAVLREIRKKSAYDLPAWVKQAKTKAQCCAFKMLIQAEESQRDGYRNKTSFTIGQDFTGRPCIGFTLGRTENHITTVCDPSECLHVPKEAKAARNLLQKLVESSPYAPYCKINQSGFWRELVVRSNRAGDVMLVIQAKGDNLSADELGATKAGLIECVKSSTNPEISSVYFQSHSGVSNKAPDNLEMELIWGQPHIYETLSGLKFRISPNSFFQVNTSGAEALYGVVGDMLGAYQDSIVFDICCGTGTIGLSLASRAKEVVGVDIVPSAIQDACANATLNGITNARFVTGKAEEVLLGLLEEYHSFPSVAVLDPPRSGAHTNVLKAIRKCEGLKRLVYVSCSQKVLPNDLAQLCRSESNTMVGTPFRPVQAIAVDMFPHTEHCELVVLLERIDSPTFSKIPTQSKE